MSKFIIYIDASIQSSGVSIYNVDTMRTQIYCYSNKVKSNIEFSTEQFDVFIEKQLKKPKDFDDNFQRYIHISDNIVKFIYEYVKCDDFDVYIEGYAFAAKGLTFNIGEFGALLRLPFYKKGHIVHTVAPSEWKKEVTGKGNAKKEVIYKEMLKTELGEVLGEFVARGYPWKKGSWVEDIADVYSIQKFIENKLK